LRQAGAGKHLQSGEEGYDSTGRFDKSTAHHCFSQN
jgi:hypothetical protein